MIHIISDIHGCFYTLHKLLARVREYDSEANFVFVGDYADRGLNSSQVVDLLVEEQEKNGAICLRGNHDDVIDWILNQESATDMQEMIVSSPSLLTVGVWWLNNGFAPTLTSYGISIESGSDYAAALESFVEKVPDTHKKFYRRLPLYWENETHFACHGYLNPRLALPRKFDMLPSSWDHDTLWSRFQPNMADRQRGGLNPSIDPVWDRIGVFGHTPVQEYGAVAPIKYKNIRLIDTAAFRNEYLTAYCCEQDSWILQATDSRDIATEQ